MLCDVKPTYGGSDVRLKDVYVFVRATTVYTLSTIQCTLERAVKSSRIILSYMSLVVKGHFDSTSKQKMLALFSVRIPKQMVRERFEMISNIFSVTQFSTLTTAHEKGPPPESMTLNTTWQYNNHKSMTCAC